MKNIHVLPTEKPSRLFKAGIEFIFDISEVKYTERYKELHNYINHTQYITSDEEINKGDWFLEPINNSVLKLKDNADKLINSIFPTCKKIILTTDQDLIKDGVQAIDDEFLEWFVKNPSCEEVGVKHFGTCCGNQLIAQCINCKKYNPVYKIIIPKEEPKNICIQTGLPCGMQCLSEEACNSIRLKQETLEEAALDYSGYEEHRMDFIAGAKWQQEQILDFLYSEITERRDYSASKMCEKVIEFIKNISNEKKDN